VSPVTTERFDTGRSSGRDTSTPVRQVFGDVTKGTECRVCGRNVDDGRAKYCSDYCRNLAKAVMGLLNWSTVRRRVIERDDEQCQICGWDRRRERTARNHIRDIIREEIGERPAEPALDEFDNWSEEDWQEYREEADKWERRRNGLRQIYGDPHKLSKGLEVDHIRPVSEGGHPFDPGNLQTLCEDCHQRKTSLENSERAEARTSSRGELNQSLFDYLAARSDPGGE
jgi:5-methylcytosine-specific restriction endonuclease McrA